MVASDLIEGLEGLKDKPRRGRPPDVPEHKLSKIRSDLSENPSFTPSRPTICEPNSFSKENLIQYWCPIKE